MLIIVRNRVTFFVLIFQAFLEKYEYLGITLSDLTKIQILIELTNTNKCSSLRSIIKCYFVGYSPYSDFGFNVTHKKSKNIDSTKEDVFFNFTSGNSLNVCKCGIFHHSACFYGLQFVTKKQCVFCNLYYQSHVITKLTEMLQISATLSNFQKI